MVDGTHSGRALEGFMMCKAFSPLGKGPKSEPAITQGLTTGRRVPRGFSLLEVLVAFTILALTLGVLMQVFSRALNTSSLSGTYGRATALAEAGLGLVGVDIPLRPGSQGGETEDGLRWQVQVAEVALDNLLPGEAPVPAYTITSQVSWDSPGGGRQVILSTLRLGEAVPES